MTYQQVSGVVRGVILLCLLAFLPSAVAAQEDSGLRQIFVEAENDFQLGRLEQAQKLLTTHLAAFRGNLKQEVYRLLALCYMAQDKERETQDFAQLLLKENPNYYAVNDPPRFTDLLSRIKSGRNTIITTASNQAENIDEAPVPVTLITEEMIKDIGAKNLLEVLTTYVPGMTVIESVNGLNFAMRGVYKSTQQSVLIMVDGHRINSHSTHDAAPDYAMSLAKVKQIEVLRGPASSLYGNVALTSVINIITKNASDTDGVNISGGIGNYGQRKGDLVFGKAFSDFSVTGWASFYKSAGETFHETKEECYGLYPLEGDVILHGFMDKPTVDIGFKFMSNGFYAFYNYHHSKLVPSYSMDLFQAPYSYDRYRIFNGQKPGHGNATHHGEVGYQRSFGNLTLKASVGADFEMANNYDVAGDTIPPVTSIKLDVIDTVIVPTVGCYQIMSYNSYQIDAAVNAYYNYTIAGNKGSLIAGCQMGRYKQTDNSLYVGDKFSYSVYTTSSAGSYLANESEGNMSVFAQVKQRYRNFIFNAGLRYDARKRFSFHGTKRALSPRIALIYLRDNWQMKVSFNRSFVDASYFLRANTLPLYSGAVDLSPETMNSFQYTFNYRFQPINLSYECNLFYNHQKDLIYYDSEKASLGSAYYNAGYFNAMGMEHIVNYRQPDFRCSANLTWQHAISSENYVTTGHRVNNVPKLSYNIIVAKSLLKRSNHELWLHASANGMSGQISYVAPLPYTQEDEYIDVPARLLCALGLDWQWKQIDFAANVHNLFNTKYRQGGTSRSPIRQPGRWFLATLSFKL